jgi:outer membrane protein TolC
MRQQDLNDAKVSQLLLQDKLQQLKISLEQQYSSLKILCDIPLKSSLSITQPWPDQPRFDALLTANSQLLVKSFDLQRKAAKSDWRVNQVSNLPVVSLVYSNSWYQNSNGRFFDNNPNVKWLNAVYVGAKISFNIPDITHIVSSRNARITYEIARIADEHTILQNDLNNDILKGDYLKAFSGFVTNQPLARLKEENYLLALNQYNQAILGLDKLLIAFNDMLAAKLNACTATANVLFTKSKIDINNSIK